MSKQSLLKALQSVENMHEYMAAELTQTIITDIRASIENSTTLRDQFAIAVMTGRQALPDERTYGGRRSEYKDLSVEEWQTALLKEEAEFCYIMADKMLEARKLD